MLKLKVPTEKRFFFKQNEESDALIDANSDDHEGFASFRQATTGETEIRTGLTQSRKWRQEEGNITLYDDFNADFLARTEVRLTLTSTDIEFPDGTQLAFHDGKISNEKQFNKWWNILPPKWARTLHKKCLEVNPLWDMSKSDDTD